MTVGASVAAAATSYTNPVPANGSQIAAANPVIQLTVTDPQGVNTSSLIMKVDGIKVAGRWSGSTVRYQPASLKNGAHTVSVSVLNYAGVRSTYTWSFIVRAAPVVGILTPADGSTVSTDGPAISAVVSPNGVALASWSMIVDGGPVSASYSPLTKLLSYELPAPLKNDQVHSVTLAVTDATGASATITWSFRVQIYPDMAANFGCTECHVTYPAAHPRTNCDACHGVSGPIGGAYGPPDFHPDEEAVLLADCTYCHGSNIYPTVPNHDDLGQSHGEDRDMTGCDCHVRDLSIEHNRWADDAGNKYTCVTCHGPDAAQRVKDAMLLPTAPTCTDCHTLSGPHGFDPAAHTSDKSADTTSGTWPYVDTTANYQGVPYNEPYAYSATCSECHVMLLTDEHSKATASSSSIGSSVCDACHPSPRNSLTSGWDKSCAQGGCHTATGTIEHENTSDAHKMGTADVAAGCGFTNATNGRRPCHYQDLVQEHNRKIDVRINPATGAHEIKTLSTSCAECHNSAAFTNLGATGWDGSCGACHNGTTLPNHSLVGSTRYQEVYTKHNNPAGYYDNGTGNSGANAMDAHGPIRANPDPTSANKTIGCGSPTCHTQAYIGGGWPYYTTACAGCHGANIAVPDPYQGSYAWYSDYWFDDEAMDTRLTITLDPITLPAASRLEFKTWYDIEKDWDYGYVQISTDNGATWTNLATSFTTNTNPYGQNLGNGITGSSGGGWVDGDVDLSAYAGQTVSIRFAYIGDFYVYGLGWMLDNIIVGPPGAPVFTDDVETVKPEMSVTTEVTYYDYDLGDYVTKPTNLTGWKRFTR